MLSCYLVRPEHSPSGGNLLSPGHRATIPFFLILPSCFLAPLFQLRGREWLIQDGLDFNKLSTPIKSVAAYPDVPTQCARFAGRGWSNVQAQSLWSAWNDDRFLSIDDRRKLDEVEPFDEWEEFCLFASHYLLLHATNYGKQGVNPGSADGCPKTRRTEATTTYKPLAGHHGLRRFGAAMIASDTLGRASILNCMGLGPTTRLPSYDIYQPHGSGGDIRVKPTGPSSRMCHSLTDLGTRGTLLVGGRNSPSRPKDDCWLFSSGSHQWERTRDLPIPLYRHAVCRLSGSAMALLIGGKSGVTTVSSAAMLFDPDKGWVACKVQGPVTPRPVFGAMLTCSGREQDGMPIFHGFLIGGVSDGVIQNQILAWDLVLSDREVGGTCHRSTATPLTRTGPFYCVQAGRDRQGLVHTAVPLRRHVRPTRGQLGGPGWRRLRWSNPKDTRSPDVLYDWLQDTGHRRHSSFGC